AGRIGRLHARLLRETRGIDAVVLADVEAERASEVARDTGIEAALSIESAFDGADAVVMAAAPSAHPELIREAIRRGMPAFCEKPLAGNLDESIAIAAEIDRSGIPFQLGFQRRFDAGYREAHD